MLYGSVTINFIGAIFRICMILMKNVYIYITFIYITLLHLQIYINICNNRIIYKSYIENL